MCSGLQCVSYDTRQMTKHIASGLKHNNDFVDGYDKAFASTSSSSIKIRLRVFSVLYHQPIIGRRLSVMILGINSD